jgi:L-lactate dehydrogenase complex protein LldF
MEEQNLSGNDIQSSKSSYPLSVNFLEPSINLTREHFIRVKIKELEEGKYQQIEVEEIKKKLKSIREENMANFSENIKSFQNLLNKEGIKSFYAKTAKDAADYIENILHESKLNTICINNSSVIRETLSEIGGNVDIVDTYNANYKEAEDTIPLKHWEFSIPSEGQIWNSFDISSLRYKEAYNFLALLGVNAASSKDGSIFFVQHFRNIKNLVEMAKKTIFVISLEKIVKDFEQGIFISKSAGLFGVKSILLGVMSNEMKYRQISTDRIAEEFEKVEKLSVDNIHVILLDNGRKDLLRSEYQELLHCINCRACGAVCPRSLFGEGEEYRTPRELVLLHFTKGLQKTVEEGLYDCSLCGGCEIACPLTIPLPDFLQKIRDQTVKGGFLPEKHLMLGENVKNFGNPYGKGDRLE